MPRGSQILGQSIDEEKWKRAKARAEEEGHEGDYAYIMDIYKKMTHLGEFKHEHIAARKKTGKKLPAWKKENWDAEKKRLKVKKSMNTVHLIISKGELDEFRCEDCGTLLLKGTHLEKALIEVKCKVCGSLVINLE